MYFNLIGKYTLIKMLIPNALQFQNHCFEKKKKKIQSKTLALLGKKLSLEPLHVQEKKKIQINSRTITPSGKKIWKYIYNIYK